MRKGTIVNLFTLKVSVLHRTNEIEGTSFEGNVLRYIRLIIK